ncbi:condensation domain-containing protein, partial [Kroppenstedtia guangzhouensis]|uniref:condensation domain-containing protein n=1 Tax=Kroppenstedtia guangzhouensis TaxID=1274356 RepID=UPI001668ED4D
MFQRKNIQAITRLSPMQRGILFHVLKEDNPSVYFEQVLFELKGKADPSGLRRSWDYLVKSHDALRTVIVHQKVKEPVQIILKEHHSAFRYEDLSDMEPSDRDDWIRRFKEEERNQRYDLARDALVRLTLLQTGDNTYQMLFSFHHILMDGWCVGLLINQLLKVYLADQKREKPSLSVSAPYQTFIEYLDRKDEEESLRFWRNQLADLQVMPFLPKRPDRVESSYDRRRHPVRFSSEETLSVTELAKKLGVTVSNLVHGVWGVLLQRYLNSEDVLFGSVVSGRPSDLPGVEQMIGLFINTIPVRVNTKKGETFSQLVKRIQEVSISSQAHHHISPADLQAQITEARFDHIVAFENYPLDDSILDNPELRFQLIPKDSFEQTNYDLVLQFQLKEELQLWITYNHSVIDSNWIQLISGHFQSVLQAILRDPDTAIEQLEILTAGEQSLLKHFNDTRASYPKDATLVSLFEEQAARQGERVAVKRGERVLTYRELNEEANRLAHALRERGLARE